MSSSASRSSTCSWPSSARRPTNGSPAPAACAPRRCREGSGSSSARSPTSSTGIRSSRPCRSRVNGRRTFPRTSFRARCSICSAVTRRARHPRSTCAPGSPPSKPNRRGHPRTTPRTRPPSRTGSPRRWTAYQAGTSGACSSSPYARRREQPSHTRSRAEMNSEATRPASRTPVSLLNASSSVAVPVDSRIWAAVPSAI